MCQYLSPIHIQFICIGTEVIIIDSSDNKTLILVYGERYAAKIVYYLYILGHHRFD